MFSSPCSYMPLFENNHPCVFGLHLTELLFIIFCIIACLFILFLTHMVQFMYGVASVYAREMIHLHILEVLGHQQCLCDPSNSQRAIELLSS